MSVRIEKLHPLFAAEIWGVDLRRDLPPDQIKLIEETVDKYAVVAIHGPLMTDEQHLRFSRLFGPLELPPDMGTTSLAGAQRQKRFRPELYDASNLDEKGEINAPDAMRRRYSKGNELFHSDSSFNDLPSKWSLLLAHVVPPEGGNTEFIDTRVVYEDLPESMKRKIDGLVAEHSLWHSRKRGGLDQSRITEDMKKAMPPAHHPVVRTAADGRKALFIGAHASHIVGWPEEEGRALLDELNAFAAQPKYIYSHKWTVGDLVIWDNRCTLHRGTAFDDLKYKRDMRRASINEYGPERASTDPVAA